MKDFVIKCCSESGFLRREALSCALEFERDYSDRKLGSMHGCMWTINHTNGNDYQIYVYHTKTQIVDSVMKRSKPIKQ